MSGTRPWKEDKARTNGESRDDETDKVEKLEKRVNELEMENQAQSQIINRLLTALKDPDERTPSEELDEDDPVIDVAKKFEDAADERSEIKEHVGLKQARENGIPEDLPRLMRLAELPEKDRTAQLSENQQRAVAVWSTWDIYADKKGSHETLDYSEIRKVLQSRRGGDRVRYETIKRVADMMVRLGEGMLEVDDSPEDKTRIKRKKSVDEWRRDHYERKKQERERRKAEAKIEAKEEAEAFEERQDLAEVNDG